MRNMIPTASATMISGITNSRTISLSDGGSPTAAASAGAAPPPLSSSLVWAPGAAPGAPPPGCFNTSDGMGNSVIRTRGEGLLCPAGCESTLDPPRRQAIIAPMARHRHGGNERSADRTGERSRRYHDRVARQYDAIYDDPYWEFHDELTWRLIKPHLPRDATAACCDLGCGTGKWGLKLLKSGFATTFVDHSGAMVEQARHKAEAMGPKA